MKVFISIIILSICTIIVHAFVQEMECKISSFISAHQQQLPYQGRLVVVVAGETLINKKIGNQECGQGGEEDDKIKRRFADKNFFIVLMHEPRLISNYIEPIKIKSIQPKRHI